MHRSTLLVCLVCFFLWFSAAESLVESTTETQTTYDDLVRELQQIHAAQKDFSQELHQVQQKLVDPQDANQLLTHMSEVLHNLQTHTDTQAISNENPIGRCRRNTVRIAAVEARVMSSCLHLMTNKTVGRAECLNLMCDIGGNTMNFLPYQCNVKLCSTLELEITEDPHGQEVHVLLGSCPSAVTKILDPSAGLSSQCLQLESSTRSREMCLRRICELGGNACNFDPLQQVCDVRQCYTFDPKLIPIEYGHEVYASIDTLKVKPGSCRDTMVKVADRSKNLELNCDLIEKAPMDLPSCLNRICEAGGNAASFGYEDMCVVMNCTSTILPISVVTYGSHIYAALGHMLERSCP